MTSTKLKQKDQCDYRQKIAPRDRWS